MTGAAGYGSSNGLKVKGLCEEGWHYVPFT